eukprot:53127-Eustigmatos_ZCMA.PRE.1
MSRGVVANTAAYKTEAICPEQHASTLTVHKHILQTLVGQGDIDQWQQRYNLAGVKRRSLEVCKSRTL